jgi:hypothetical protein
MVVVGQRHAQAALSPGITRYPLYRGLGGPQSQSERFGEEKIILPLPGFEPQNVQSVA